MPLCPQITITPITVTSTNMTVTSVIAGGEPATTEKVAAVQTTADNAWSAALGKNTVFYSATAPSTSGRTVGDVWFDTANGNRMYGWNGSAWTLYQFGTATFQNASVDLSKLADGSVSAAKLIDGAVIAGKIAASAVGTNELAANSVVAGKIAASTITGDKIAASTITASNIAAGTITTDKLVAGTLTGFTINNGSGTFQVTSGGAVTASSGTIGGFTLSSSSLTSTNLGLYNSSSSTIAATGNIAGGSLTSTGEIQGGSLSITGTGTVSGNLTADAQFYIPNRATSSSAANVRMNTITGQILETTSSRRYKKDIEPAAIPASSVLQLEAKTFAPIVAEDGVDRVLGLIAEEVAEIPVLADLLVNYDSQGRPDSISYDRLAVALLDVVKDLSARVAALEAR